MKNSVRFDTAAVHSLDDRLRGELTAHDNPRPFVNVQRCEVAPCCCDDVQLHLMYSDFVQISSTINVYKLLQPGNYDVIMVESRIIIEHLDIFAIFNGPP